MTIAGEAAPTTTAQAVREALRAKTEIALVDVREEDPFAQAHALFAAQLPLSRLELDSPWRLLRRDMPVVVVDDGEGLAPLAAARLRALGYTRVSLLDGGLEAGGTAAAQSSATSTCRARPSANWSSTTPARRRCRPGR